MSNQTISRIAKELKNLQEGNDLSLAVACQESDIRKVKALIIGPPDTPYEYGFFEFVLNFGSDYPSQPPKVEARTTNKGQCRFNPNIYAQGKVCLSILGTWRGETSGEEWSSAQGLESILISIQSLMSSNPYENEPGYEDQSRASEEDKAHPEAYVAKIRHETIRIAVIQKLEKILGVAANGTLREEPVQEWYSSSSESEDQHARRKRQKREEALLAANFEPFEDLLKQRFLWYYESYITTCETHLKLNPDGTKFTRMPFEMQNNTMDGQFQYTALLTRLKRLKSLIDAETNSWAAQGLLSLSKESSIACKLSHQFSQLTHHHKTNNIYHVSMSLAEAEESSSSDGKSPISTTTSTTTSTTPATSPIPNPFLWTLTYLGKPSTLLDGAILKLRIHLSPLFPDIQPRVRVLTPIFHHRVSPTGVLCYFPRKTKTEDMGEHVRAVMEALEDEEPVFDPRTVVRGEASRLLWGSEEERKRYKRAVRRSAEESMELL